MTNVEKQIQNCNIMKTFFYDYLTLEVIDKSLKMYAESKTIGESERRRLQEIKDAIDYIGDDQNIHKNYILKSR